MRESSINLFRALHHVGSPSTNIIASPRYKGNLVLGQVLVATWAMSGGREDPIVAGLLASIIQFHPACGEIIRSNINWEKAVRVSLLSRVVKVAK